MGRCKFMTMHRLSNCRRQQHKIKDQGGSMQVHVDVQVVELQQKIGTQNNRPGWIGWRSAYRRMYKKGCPTKSNCKRNTHKKTQIRSDHSVHTNHTTPSQARPHKMYQEGMTAGMRLAVTASMTPTRAHGASSWATKGYIPGTGSSRLWVIHKHHPRARSVGLQISEIY